MGDDVSSDVKQLMIFFGSILGIIIVLAIVPSIINAFNNPDLKELQSKISILEKQVYDMNMFYSKEILMHDSEIKSLQQSLLDVPKLKEEINRFENYNFSLVVVFWINIVLGFFLFLSLGLQLFGIEFKIFDLEWKYTLYKKKSNDVKNKESKDKV